MPTTYDEAIDLVARWNRAKAVVATAEKTRRSFPEVYRRAVAEAEYLESISKGALEAYVAENEGRMPLDDEEAHWVNTWMDHGQRRLASIAQRAALAVTIERQAGQPLTRAGKAAIETMPDAEVLRIFDAAKAAKAREVVLR